MDHTTRKLQKVGGGTYTISVPKEWAVEQDLSAGTPVDVFRSADGSLRLQRANSDDGPLTETTLAATGDDAPDRLVDHLRAAYTAGFETITITNPEGFTRGQRRALVQSVRRYNGLEVMTKTDTELTVTDVLDHDAISIDRTLTRLQFIAHSHLRAGVAALHGTRTPDADHTREAEAARLADQVTRSVARALSSPSASHHIDAAPATLIERRDVACTLQDIYARATVLEELATHIDTAAIDDSGATDDLETLAETTITLVEDATTALLGDPSNTTPLALDALDHREEAGALVSTLDDTLASAGVPGAYALGRATAILDTVADRGGALAIIALRTAARSDRRHSPATP